MLAGSAVYGAPPPYPNLTGSNKTNVYYICAPFLRGSRQPRQNDVKSPAPAAPRPFLHILAASHLRRPGCVPFRVENSRSSHTRPKRRSKHLSCRQKSPPYTSANGSQWRPGQNLRLQARSGTHFGADQRFLAQMRGPPNMQYGRGAAEVCLPLYDRCSTLFRSSQNPG